MNATAWSQGILVLSLALSSSLVGAQSEAPSPAAFESASVKPALPDAPQAGLGWMIGLGHEVPPHGLLTITGPLPPLIIFAYNVQDEVEARAMRSRLPEWARQQKFTIVARSPQDAPTMEQIRAMMRALLGDRFALKAHRDTHTGTVNLLIVAKAGVTGPGLRPHNPAQPCIQRGTKPQDTFLSSAPMPHYCGLDLQSSPDTGLHVRMIDVTLPEACTLLGGLGGVLGGRSMDTVVDNTGLTGKWDIAFDFMPERDGPASDAAADASGRSFTSALEKQLGLRLKKGTGQIEALIVDHIAQPAPD